MIPRSCFGRILNIKQRDKRGSDEWKKFLIDNYSQEKCKMDDGTPSHYVTCKALKEPGIVINLHPEFIAKVFAGIEPTVRPPPSAAPFAAGVARGAAWAMGSGSGPPRG